MMTKTTFLIKIFVCSYLLLPGLNALAQPVITLNGNSTVYIAKNSNYTSPGATAYDSIDGNLTDSIKLLSDVYVGMVGIYTENYSVRNSRGQFGYATRIVVVNREMTPPVLKLMGADTIYIEASRTNPAFQDPGATASDNEAPFNLTSAIVVDGQVNTRQVGIYTLTYNVQDVSGNKSDTITRIVIVGDTRKPVWINTASPRYLPFGKPFVDSVRIADAYDPSIAMYVSHPVTGPVDVYTPGKYDYIYTADADSSGNMPDTLFMSYIVQAKVSITDIKTGMFSTFPNPVADMLRIDLGQLSGPVQVTLCASDGRHIHTHVAKQDAGHLLVDVSALARGMYFVNIEMGGKIYSEKIIKE